MVKIITFYLCVLAVVLPGVYTVPLEDYAQEDFELFKNTHGKEYENELEENFRFEIFLENTQKIADHNERFERGEVSYKLGMNHFGDMTLEEFQKTMNGYKQSKKAQLGSNSSFYSLFVAPEYVDAPDSVDWREKGAVTPVKNQAGCSSCWSFSSTGSLEGQSFLKTGKLVSLSEQNLIDCSTQYGNEGCNGGTMQGSFAYVQANGGIDTETGYPYLGSDGSCDYKPQSKGASDQGSVSITPGSESDLQAAVATNGPISVAIDASKQSFQFYSGGVYYEESCSSQDLDHAVLVVGYGTSEDGEDYWIVKNSWGTQWGQEGYVLMARNKENNCGIASDACYPIV